MLINRFSETINVFRIHFQEYKKVFHPKAPVCKSKLQTCPDPWKVGFIIYSAHTLQVHHLIENVLIATERENGGTIKTFT